MRDAEHSIKYAVENIKVQYNTSRVLISDILINKDKVYPVNDKGALIKEQLSLLEKLQNDVDA